MKFFRPSIFLVLVLAETSNAVTDKPNIITILIDDLGWNDVGFHGSDQISTPNIDALAYSGIILNRHYVLPTCTPSRAALMTGLYPIRIGMQGYPMKCGTRRGVPLSAKLKPEYLKDLGYHTHLVGKWHLGYPSHEYLPTNRGFDSFFGYYNGYISYFQYGVAQDLNINNTTLTYSGYDLHKDDHVDWKWRGKYATNVFAARAKKIIQNHNRADPLYLFVAHLGVHTGITEGSGLEVPKDVDVDNLYAHIKQRQRRELAGVLQEVDNSIGVIVKALKKNNMLHKSIILVLSDNGAHTISTDMQPNWSSNWPLRGAKFTLFEGGVRGAALIWSPLLPKGVVSEQFIHISDWLPTFYYAAETDRCWSRNYTIAHPSQFLSVSIVKDALTAAAACVTSMAIEGGNMSHVENLDGVNVWNSLKESSPVKRDHILLNIDEEEGEEGIIIKNRWKVKKGGIRKYGLYEYHWGKEENIGPLPSDYLSKIRQSTVGRLIRNITDYSDFLKMKAVLSSRKKSRVECSFKSDTDNIEIRDGYVNDSVNFLCQNYCVFDLLKDPCELNKTEDKKMIKKGLKLLNYYRRTLYPQGDNSVDPMADPKKWGGAWMPWLSPNTFFYT